MVANGPGLVARHGGEVVEPSGAQRRAAASSFSAWVAKKRSGVTFLATGLCVGTATTGRRYHRHNSSATSRAVPDMPASRAYRWKNVW